MWKADESVQVLMHEHNFNIPKMVSESLSARWMATFPFILN
jgi:hypothetical protein